MTFASMTGFAESTGSHEGLRWRWEAKSVNGRSLDLRLRTPPGYDGLEAPARRLAGEGFGDFCHRVGLERLKAVLAAPAPAVTPDLIEAARARISPYVRRTPIISTRPGELGLKHGVALKLRLVAPQCSLHRGHVGAGVDGVCPAERRRDVEAAHGVELDARIDLARVGRAHRDHPIGQADAARTFAHRHQGVEGMGIGVAAGRLPGPSAAQHGGRAAAAFELRPLPAAQPAPPERPRAG